MSFYCIHTDEELRRITDETFERLRPMVAELQGRKNITARKADRKNPSCLLYCKNADWQKGGKLKIEYRN